METVRAIGNAVKFCLLLVGLTIEGLLILLVIGLVIAKLIGG